MLHPTHAILQSQNGSTFNRHTGSIILVAGLHIVLAWGLLNGIVQQVIPVIDDIVVTTIKPATKAPPVDPVTPPVQVLPQQPTLVVPAPIFHFDGDAGGTAPTSVTVPETVARQPETVIPDSGPVASNPRSIPPYPALEARLGHEGAATIRLTISENGLIMNAELVKSSGFGRLDEAAVNWVLANWKYRPAIRNGQPVASTTEVIVNFRLNSRR